MKSILLSFTFVLLGTCVFAQGLEDVFVETYYVSDANDATDTDGGSLAVGSVTYRIFVDMAPGYELQAVYGNSNHTLRIETSTYFFNNLDRGETTGRLIPDSRIDENTVALDSWIAMSGATTLRVGVLKSEDTNGSLVGGVNNDGGSAAIAGGLLVNADPLAGIALTTSDGLIAGVGPTVTPVGIDLSMFDNINDGPVFLTNSGAWSVLEGVQGPTATNRVLIAQITTNGEMSFELNIQLGTPLGGTEQYVASNPVGAEQYFAALTYPSVSTPGCTDVTACNFDPSATDDDGTCTYPGCVDDTACNYNGDAGCDDGSCVYAGCIDDTACNYNPDAGCDDGSCVYAGCIDVTACNYNVAAGCDDGSCTYPGCTNPNAPNYNPAAGCDDGSCETCVGDLNNDGAINVSDILLFAAQFGCSSGCGNGDINNDGAVNISDLLLLTGAFGTTCN